MKTKMLLSAALLLALALPTARADDLARLQGTWTGQVGPDEETKVNITIKGHDVTLDVTTKDGDEHQWKGEVKLDADAKPHKTLDWVRLTRSNGETMPDYLGIYEFPSDDELKICSGTTRPTEFKAGDDGPPHLNILKRVKSPAAAGAAAPGDDLARFQGKWITQVGPQKNIALAVVIKGNAVTLAGTAPNGQDFELKGEIKLDPAARPHRTLDWVHFVRPDGEDAPENLAIYEFEGDGAIKICSGGPGNERPTEFKAGENGPPNIIVLKREK